MQEYPSIRRVKPLPKRRRTTGPVNQDDILSSFSTDAQQFLPQFADSDVIPTWPSLTQCYQPIVPSATDVSHLDGTGPKPTVDFYSARNFSATVTPSDNDDHLDDSGDHFQQPENKKKRKVPSAHALSGVGTFGDSSETSLVSDPKLEDVEGIILHKSHGGEQLDSHRGNEIVPTTNSLHL